MGKLIIIDGNNWFRRKAESDITGFPVRTCFNIIRNMRDPVVVVWDGYNSLEPRRKIYPEYKKGRNKPGEDFYSSQKLFQEILELTQAVQVKVDGFEGDDVIAAIAKQYCGSCEIYIDSNDADLGQLGFIMSRPTPLPEKAHMLALYKTIVGDSSDNIPGAKGFGKTTWAKLTEEQKNTLHQIVVSGFAMTEEEITEKVQEFYPKGALIWFLVKENREKLLDFYKIVNFLPIPWKQIEDNMKAGINRPDLVEPILKEFML